MTEKRIYGIDLLRIFSMLGVIVLHIMRHGNVLDTTNSNIAFSMAWFIEILAYPAVNCYVLISGFVGYRDSKYYPKIKNIISLFFTVLFYSFLICIIFKIVTPDVISKKDILTSCFPILTNQYWFFTTYIMMILASPMLNMLVHKADTRMLHITVVLITVCTLLSKFPLINLSDGFSFIWFTMLYLLGAIIKKENYVNRISSFQSLILIIGSVLITWSTKIILHFNNINYSILQEDIFISYCSITMLAFAVGLLCVFAKLNTFAIATKIIAFLTPMVFSVYLLHDNNYIRAFLIKDRFIPINDFNASVMPFMVLGCSIGIFIVCSLIDLVRIGLFKLLHIDKTAEKIGNYISSNVNKFFPEKHTAE